MLYFLTHRGHPFASRAALLPKTAEQTPPSQQRRTRPRQQPARCERGSSAPCHSPAKGRGDEEPRPQGVQVGSGWDRQPGAVRLAWATNLHTPGLNSAFHCGVQTVIHFGGRRGKSVPRLDLRDLTVPSDSL